MKISIDIDGVLRDFIFSLVFTYKKYYPSHIIQPIKSFDVDKYFPENSGVDMFWKDHAYEVMFKNAPMIKDADRGMKYLRRFGHEIIITTAQTEQTIEPTMMWLKKHKIKFDHLYSTREKQEVDFDIHIDDDPKYISKIVKAGKKAIIFSSTQNKDTVPKEIEEQCIRVKDWQQIIDIFEDLAKVQSHVKNFISFRNE